MEWKKTQQQSALQGTSKGLPALRMFSLLPLSFPCAHDGDHLRESLSKTSQQAGLPLQATAWPQAAGFQLTYTVLFPNPQEQPCRPNKKIIFMFLTVFKNKKTQDIFQPQWNFLYRGST